MLQQSLFSTARRVLGGLFHDGVHVPCMSSMLRQGFASDAAVEQRTESTSSQQTASVPADVSSSAPSTSAPAMGPRQVIRQRVTGRAAAYEGIVHVHNTLNNIILSLTDEQGNVKASVSAGAVGFRNARKTQPVAAEKAAEELAKRALKMGYRSVVVKMKGVGSNKTVAVQSLHASGLQIKTLMDVTAIPYNGCRLPKRRRV